MFIVRQCPVVKLGSGTPDSGNVRSTIKQLFQCSSDSASLFQRLYPSLPSLIPRVKSPRWTVAFRENINIGAQDGVSVSSFGGLGQRRGPPPMPVSRFDTHHNTPRCRPAVRPRKARAYLAQENTAATRASLRSSVHTVRSRPDAHPRIAAMTRARSALAH